MDHTHTSSPTRQQATVEERDMVQRVMQVGQLLVQAVLPELPRIQPSHPMRKSRSRQPSNSSASSGR